MAEEHTHTHTDACYRVSYPSCGKQEHTHAGVACYYVQGERAGQLKCSQTEHTHDRVGCASAIGPFCGYP